MFSALYKTGDHQFQTNFAQERDFHAWFSKTYDVDWAVLVKNSDGQVVCTGNKTGKVAVETPKKEVLSLELDEVAGLEKAIKLLIAHVKLSPTRHVDDEVVLARYDKLLAKTAQLHQGEARASIKITVNL